MNAIKVGMALAITLTASLGAGIGAVYAQDAKPVLKVATNATPSPLGGYNSQTKDFVGIAVDFIRVVAQDLGAQIELVATPAGDQMAALTGKKVDIVASDLGTTPDGAREKLADFTYPYAIVRDVLIVKGTNKAIVKTQDDLKALSLATLKGSAYAEALTKLGAKVQLFDTVAELVKAVDAGTVEGAIFANYNARDTFRGGANSSLAAIDSYQPPLVRNELSFAVQKGNASLLARMNDSVLQHLSRDTIEKLGAKYGVNSAPSLLSQPCLCAP